MLVLERREGQSVDIDGPCKLTVTWIGRNRVRLGFDADKDVVIMRSEIAKERTESTGTDGDPSRQGGCGGQVD